MIGKYMQEFFGVGITSDTFGEVRYLGTNYSDNESDGGANVKRRCKDKTTPNNFKNSLERVC